MDYILTTENLTKRYRHSVALDGLSMHVPNGAIYGFVGRNGAGKTTLIRLICGLQEPSGGSFTLYGIPNSHKDIPVARQRMGAMVEAPAIYPDLTAADNLKQLCLLRGLPFDSIPSLLELVGLAHTGRKTVRRFSLGMKQRLGIAIALAGEPSFLVLDEPTNGLDPQGILELRELLLRLNREKGITVLISSHNLDELSRLATHYGILHQGRMIRELSSVELEDACRKYTRIEVTNPDALTRVLKALEIDHKRLCETEAALYTRVSITQLTLALAKEGCEVLAIEEKEESLESFFLSLTGGVTHG